MASTPIPPLKKSVTVPWSQEASFRRFTAEIGSWWPLRTHSVGEDRAEAVIFECRPGGRIYEKIKGGEESTWGKVTAWEPPQRVAFLWHPGQDSSRAQDIEVRFVPEGSGTRLERAREVDRRADVAPRAAAAAGCAQAQGAECGAPAGRRPLIREPGRARDPRPVTSLSCG